LTLLRRYNVLIPNLNTFADLIDRLIVEVNKLAYFENRKREEHKKALPDLELIAKWDNLSRDCCEYRSLLKNEINKCLSRISEEGKYETLQEVRTFSKPLKNVSDILSDMCMEIANSSLSGELQEAIQREISKGASK
jgi:hypothetical protein